MWVLFYQTTRNLIAWIECNEFQQNQIYFTGQQILSCLTSKGKESVCPCGISRLHIFFIRIWILLNKSPSFHILLVYNEARNLSKYPQQMNTQAIMPPDVSDNIHLWHQYGSSIMIHEAKNLITIWDRDVYKSRISRMVENLQLQMLNCDSTWERLSYPWYLWGGWCMMVLSC